MRGRPGRHLFKEAAGLLGQAQAVGARPGLDFSLGEIGPADDQLDQVGVEPGEERDDVQPVRERAAVGRLLAWGRKPWLALTFADRFQRP